MTNEMIDRVAGALLMRSRSVMDGPNYPSPADCEHLARAAIEAMRDPTPEMVLAGWKSPGWDDTGCADSESAADVWRAMIDTALADPLPVHKAKME
jgi:hypothetical protein